jgi:hypothetical protein
MLDKCLMYASIDALVPQISKAPKIPFDNALVFTSIQEYNSLSNLDALRGIFGAHPGVGVRTVTLARHSLSMRKPCLESYILETAIWFQKYHK